MNIDLITVFLGRSESSLLTEFAFVSPLLYTCKEEEERGGGYYTFCRIISCNLQKVSNVGNVKVKKI